MSVLASFAGLALGSALFVLWSQGSTRHGPLQQANLNHRVRLSRGALVGVGLLVGVISGSPLLLVAGPAAAFGVPLASRHRRRRANIGQSASSAADTADRLAHAVRSGRSLREAHRQDLSLGAEHPGSEVAAPMAAVLATIELLAETQGPPAEALEQLADRLRLDANAVANARAQSGQQLASASVMALVPFGFAGCFALTEPAAADLYLTTWLGAACLAGSAGLSLCGWIWMQHIVDRRVRW